MNKPESSIRVKVDVTNPGQFFACCGLLELADRLWPGAEGWFEKREFCISSPNEQSTLEIILDYARSFVFDLGKDGEGDTEDDEKKRRITAIEMESPKVPRKLILDWWSEKSIKPWAGSMKERYILHAMLQAIDPSDRDPFNFSIAVHDPIPQVSTDGKRSNRKPKKREPFYFDCRRASKAHPIDLHPQEVAIYCWTMYEATKLKQAADDHPSIADRLMAAEAALIDLKEEIKHRPYFPVTSYSIKKVAPVCGFHWSQDDVNGQSAQLMYRDWLNTGDDSIIRKVKQYNREDVLAMLAVDQYVSILATGK